MRPHRSEKRPKVKLPPPVPPAPPAAAPRPNDDIRHAVLETAVEKLAVPEAKRTCPECAHFAHRDRPFRRIAITEIASSRSERSDVSS
jgi:hypothetical protein